MNYIFWPSDYEPGFTDNFASNEIIVAGFSAADAWNYLVSAYVWPKYYSNSSDVSLPEGETKLKAGMQFFFKTFGFPVNAEVTEFSEPTETEPGRISWHGWSGEPGAADRLDVIHAWLIENLPNGRVRILTQESQKGNPAKDLHNSHPNIMVNGHQDWLEGMEKAMREKI